MPYCTSSYYRTTTRPVDDREQEEKIPRIAVVRPFCSFDFGAVASTFNVWDDFVPCSALGTRSEVPVDLFLHYSQSYDDAVDDQCQDSIGIIDTIMEMKRETAWIQMNGDSLLKRTANSDGPVGPTASEYVAYLEKVEEDSQEYTVKKRGGKNCGDCCSCSVYSRKKGYENVPGSSLYKFSNRAEFYWYRKPFAFSPHPNSIEDLVGKPPSMLTKSATQNTKVLKKNMPEDFDLHVRVAEE